MNKLFALFLLQSLFFLSSCDKDLNIVKSNSNSLISSPSEEINVPISPQPSKENDVPSSSQSIDEIINSTSPDSLQKDGELIAKTEFNIEEQKLISQFMGLWKSTDDEHDDQAIIEFKDNVEISGFSEGDAIARAEFTIEQVDLVNQSIVIHGFFEELSEEEDTPKIEYYSKLELTEGGSKLIYRYDYQNQNFISEWIR